MSYFSKDICAAQVGEVQNRKSPNPDAPQEDQDRTPDGILSPWERDEIFAQMGLSARQKDIMVLLLKGMSNRRIADQLNIAEQTVSIHLRQMFRKCKVSSRTQLVLLIFQVFYNGCQQGKYPRWKETKTSICPYMMPSDLEERSRQILEEIWPTFESILVSLARDDGEGRFPAKEKNCFHAFLYVFITGRKWCRLPEHFPSYASILQRRKRWLASARFRAAWQQMVGQYPLVRSHNWQYLSFQCTRDIEPIILNEVHEEQVMYAETSPVAANELVSAV